MSPISGDYCREMRMRMPTQATGRRRSVRSQPSRGPIDRGDAAAGLAWRFPSRNGAPRLARLAWAERLDDRSQERGPRLFGLDAAGQALSELQKHLAGAVAGGDFGNH